MDFSRYLQAVRQGCVNPIRAASCYFKDSSSPPPAPDYQGAATATSQGSVQAAIANQLLNMRNTSTPLGSRSFTPSGTFSIPSIGGQPGFDIPQFSESINMTPEGQNLYNKQMGLSTGLLGLGQGSLDQTAASLGKPQDFGSVGDIADQSYAMQTSRLDPQWAQREEQQRAQMANQGLVAGGEAYDNSMREFNQARNDAYNQARLSSISTMPQTYQLSTAQRMQPLTELNAIRTGAQPQMPQFQGVPTAGGAQGPNVLGATQMKGAYDTDVYNQQVASENAFWNGLMNLGGTIGSAFISDRRLKSDIVLVGMHPLGIGIYEYDIEGRRERGVMADEVLAVKPEAVMRGADGFLRVFYGRL